MEKTVEQIDSWFNYEVKDAFDKAPEAMRDMAKGNKHALQYLAEYLAKQKNFRIPAILPILKTLLK
jgi:hypothetical protein